MTQDNKPAASSVPKIDVNFFKPIVDGTKQTLKIQCKVEATPQKPFYKSSTQAQIKVDIAGVIGIMSTAFTGSMALCFSKELYLHLLESMLGEKFPEITAELSDGVGELLNIIFGTAKAVLNDQGYDLQKAIPTIIFGENIKTRYLSKGEVIVLPFQTDHGPFQIEISTELPK